MVEITLLKRIRPLLRYRVIGTALGVLLLTAAGLKIYGLRVDAVPSLGILSSPEVKVGLIEFEIFLGVWLLSGKGPIGSWLTAIATFSVFAAVSAYQAWIGEASCGCFGRLSQYVKPWHSFTLDVGIVALLGLIRPDLSALPQNRRYLMQSTFAPLALGVLGVLVLLSLLSGAARFAYGSTDAALAHLRGELLSVRPTMVDCGEGIPGAVVQRDIEVANYSDHPVRIIGGTSDCSCITTRDLPITLAPGEVRSISIFVGLPRSGLFTRRAALMTDDTMQRQIPFRLTGRVTGEKDKSSSIARNE